MASPNENDDVPMLPISDSSSSSSRTRPFTPRSHSVSLTNTSSTIDGFDNSTVVLGYTVPLETQRQPPLVQMSGTLSSTRSPESPSVSLYDYAKGWARRFATFVNSYLPKIKNPHKKYGQSWSKIFAVSCLFAIFVDPLFFFVIKVDQDAKCLWIDGTMAYIFVAVRSVTDLLFFVYMLLQFRMAYIAPESTVVGAGQLVDHPIKVARHYFRGKFLLDFLIVLPLPQILILLVIRLGATGGNNAKNLLRTAVLIQYIPKLYRLVPFLAGQTPTGFIFESAWANFAINLSTFMLAGHFVGSCWYLLGLQRVNQCLRNACGSNSNHTCRALIDCNHRMKNLELEGLSAWIKNVNATACFQEDGFHYGIYSKAVNLTHDPSLLKRYIYSLFWGFQQISTLAGNQVPSYFCGEVLFTMGIIGLGLLLFAFLIGNMQNFLQALGRRNWETTLRRRDVDQWMRHRRLPESIRKRVKKVERSNWAATRGFNEKLIFDNMPDDLQRDIRRHLFTFLKKVRIFSGMDEPILDAFRERLKHTTYIKSSTVLHRGGLVNKMVFIVRGKMKSIGEDGSIVHLSEEDVCGEELLTWCLERSPTNCDETRIRLPSKGLLSKRTVWCVTKVEAFSLSVADVEDVTSLFSEILKESESKEQ